MRRKILGDRARSRFQTLAAAACLLSPAVAMTPGGPGGEGPDFPVPPAGSPHSGPTPCTNTVVAEVVALDQVLVWNKFGSHDPAGMMFALKRDVVSQSNSTTLTPGDVMLRPDLRPRPLTLRVNQGDCLEVRFTNLLDPTIAARAPRLLPPITAAGHPVDPNELITGDPTRTRTASFHVNGLPYFDMTADGANVGNNGNGLVAPGGSATYRFLAPDEGTFLAISMGAIAGGEGDGGSVSHGLFGAVIVEPTGSTWLHSSTGEPLLSPANEIVSGTPYAIIQDFADPDDGIEFTPEGPFREFVAIFHDEVKSVHRNPALNTEFWLQSVKDGFGINYGVSGIGQILLDALCAPDCRFEEAFLTSWANGDPALLCEFPDDPSNVWHSYLGDHVKFRNLHAGPKETHIFHLHAHQWVYTPKDGNSTYLDSQAIGPGSTFTYEIAYGGSGNRNYGIGDSIFHCHLYPHFAQGMWGLWRTHDVYEDGQRALPDGTPIPRIAPIPGRPLPPLPTRDLPGYPFFMPGSAGQWPVPGYPGDYKPGHRPPQPPYDMVRDGGLPRHVILDGQTQGTLFDRSFVPGSMPNFEVVAPGTEPNFEGNDYLILPNTGTRLEQLAMQFHSSRQVANSRTWGSVATITCESATVDPTPADYTNPSLAPTVFSVNGLPPAPGAPFGNPCPPGSPLRVYHASAIDIDMTVNNSGWHDPQARINVLDGDVAATLNGTRPPEPLFFRANSNDCIVYEHTNRTHRDVGVDAFQVQTPTDTIGQHIHLVKFDVMASDGSGNGWNYEDATFSHEEIHDRLAGMGFSGQHPASTTPAAYQTTAQRWWADPLLNGSGQDRTIRTVFTHDHFSPSTIQQHGLYSALIVEPQGSSWYDSITGTQLGTRGDGGPTTWHADIHSNGKGIREFCLAIADYALLYDEAGHPINAPHSEDGLWFREAVSASDPGGMVMNYKNEPIPLRLGVPASGGSSTVSQLRAGDAGRMASVFDSEVHGDPATPLLQMYQGDNFQVRLIQGAHEESHSFKIPRSKWLREISDPSSGYVNAQHTGISEHFEAAGLALTSSPFSPTRRGTAAAPLTTDLLWCDAAEDGLWNGIWGFLRVYANRDAIDPRTGQPTTLQPLPDNQNGMFATNRDEFHWPCPDSAPKRRYNVVATTATQVLGPNGIVYNAAAGIIDDTGLMFVLKSDISNRTGLLKKAPEPLVLRANAGDCLRINLINNLPASIASMPDHPESDARMPDITELNARDLLPDNVVGMSVDLVFADGQDTGDGAKIGYNPATHVSPGESRIYTYYCGDITFDANTNHLVATPRAFGVCGVRSLVDPIKQGAQGLVGAVIVEPEGSTWTDPNDPREEASGAVAIVTGPGTCTIPTRFREFVLVQQDGLNLNTGPTTPIRDISDDAEDSGEKAYNYRTAPFWARLGYTFVTPHMMNDVDLTNILVGDPATPIFEADVGDRVVFRLTKPAGRARSNTFAVHGHRWRELPDNPNSQVVGQQTAHTVGCNWNMWLLGGVGGPNGVAGDYLYREMSSFQFSQGLWGIMRVR